MSRSVTTPTSRPLSGLSTIGTMPQSRSHMIRAASFSESLGRQRPTSLLMTESTFMRSSFWYGSEGEQLACLKAGSADARQERRRDSRSQLCRPAPST